MRKSDCRGRVFVRPLTIVAICLVAFGTQLGGVLWGDDVLRAPEPAEAASGSAPQGITSWEPIADAMRASQVRIAEADSSVATLQMQRDISTWLDQLIAAAARKSPGDTDRPKPEGSAKDENPKGNGDAATVGSGDPGPTRQDSTERHGVATVKKPDVAARARTSAKEFWGRLPPHVRQSVLQNPTARVPPKYQAAVEEYYQRLLEAEGK